MLKLVKIHKMSVGRAFQFMENDHNTRINHSILNLIPRDAKSVLEFGDGSGVMAVVYKQMNPNVAYTNIDINSDTAKFSPETLDSYKINKNSLDCLIFNDSLNHFYDFYSVLKNCINYLNPNGQVIASISNMQYWQILLNLLQGNWDHKANPYTLESIKKVFEDCGLNVVEILGTQPQQDDQLLFEKFSNLMAPVIQGLGINQAQFFTQTKIMQYIVRAVKPEYKIKPLLIQTIIGEEKLCARVRIIEPHSFCTTIPGIRSVESIKNADLRYSESCENKVFIWQRIWPQTPAQQQQLLARNYLVIGEIDDDPLRWESFHSQNNFFAFRCCHAIQTSTEPIAEFLRQYNPNVKVFPNQLAYLPLPRAYTNKQINIFFGSVNRENDWKPILPSLNKIISNYGDKIIIKVMYDKLFYNALNTEHKQFYPLSPYKEFENILRQCDIAILPLEYNRFNSMKSDLKFLECAGHGVSVIASPTVYENYVEEGKTGLIYNSVDEFEEKLVKLIENTAFRQELAQNAYNYVAQNRLLSGHYQKRTDWYYELINNLPQLNEELNQRAPELFI